MRKTRSLPKRSGSGFLKCPRHLTCTAKNMQEKIKRKKWENTLEILKGIEEKLNIQPVPPSLPACRTLNDFGLFFGTDKSSILHDICGIYEKYLGGFRDRSINLFEFGCLEMASLNMWASYFPNGHIFGVDPAEAADPGKIKEENVSFLAHDAFDVEYMARIFRMHRPDVIIDDATHYYSHQIRGFEAYFPLLAPEGVYIVEDLETSFSVFRNGIWNDQDLNPAEYFIGLALAVCGKGQAHASLPTSLPSWVDQIESISFARDVVIIRKK